MTIKEFFSFKQNRYFWMNLIGMVLAIVGLVFIVLKGLDQYTHHGQAVVVPDVKGMRVEEAEMIFRNRGLVCQVADSSYSKTRPAGSILDYTPTAGQKVKEGRIVYLTINTIDIPLRKVPDVADNSSARQAEARLLASGFKLREVQYVAGEKDWVYGVKYQGRVLSIAEEVPVGASLTLMVGNGAGELIAEDDSTAVDNETTLQAPAPTESADDSWF